jgi:hypothetical protein
MALPKAKTAETRQKTAESYNGWSVNFADRKSNVDVGLRAGPPHPDSTLAAIVAQVGVGLTARGWPALLDRFWSRIEKTDTCWVWRGTVTSGYGQIAIGGFRQQVRFRAHRLSWMLHFGDIPADKEVAHTCDNARCVRPAHLELLTHQQNLADAARRGRMRGPRPARRVSPPRGSFGGQIRPRRKDRHV